jgi:8-oxo-dGTP pyrophosphatase MutT (NUDIX family)
MTPAASRECSRSSARILAEATRSALKTASKDAATLIIVDRSGGEPKVLLGRRHTDHVFMPGKFVFPGGRVDDGDRDVPVAAPLDDAVARKLLAETVFTERVDADAFGLAAVREAFEETGLVIGIKAAPQNTDAEGTWGKFLEAGFLPDLSGLQLIGRAITPPGFPRRFDARFIAVDRTAITHQLPGVVHAEAELVELTWLPIEQAQDLDLPLITGYMLEELQARIDAGFSPELSVPFYATRDGEFTRDLIE